MRRLGEVADAAVDHPARVAARAEGEVVALEEDDLQAAQREVARDARAVDAPADDGDVEGVLGERAIRDGHRDGVARRRDRRL